MPQEFLRDVVRTGDGTGRRPRHWSVLPLSIVCHVLVVTAFVFSPWSAGGELPAVASPLLSHFIETVAPTPPAPPSPPTPVAQNDTSVPFHAPDKISPDNTEPARVTADGGIPSGPGVEPGQPLLGALGVSGAVSPPPPPPLVHQKPVRPGGIIREPRKILHVAPLYPDIARQSRVQGVVILEAILDVSGRVQSVTVLRSQPLLDEAAIRAVREWRYTPTELNGVPVPVLMTITVRFSLDR